jgi:hypothetical protein
MLRLSYGEHYLPRTWCLAVDPLRRKSIWRDRCVSGRMALISDSLNPEWVICPPGWETLAVASEPRPAGPLEHAARLVSSMREGNKLFMENSLPVSF